MRPSANAACSITARQRAPCAGAGTVGMCSLIAGASARRGRGSRPWPKRPPDCRTWRVSPAGPVGERCPAPGCGHDVGAEILGVIELVGEVVDVELHGRLLVDLVADHGIELPQ